MGTETYKKQINSVSTKLGGGNRENAEWIWQRGKVDWKTQENWAVRISYIENIPGQKPKRKRKYIAYFTDQKRALEYLTEYNSGAIVKEHEKYSDIPTFAELYDKWKKYRKGLKNNPSQSCWKNYEIAFNLFSNLHDKKIISIRAMIFRNVFLPIVLNPRQRLEICEQ